MTIWSPSRRFTPGGKRLVLWALCGALPLLGLGYQIAAKETAMALSHTRFGLDWFARLAGLPSTLVLLGFELASFVAWMTVLSAMKLSAAFPMTAIGYVLVIATGWGLFHEHASLLQVAGGAAILGGVWLIGRAEPEPAAESASESEAEA